MLKLTKITAVVGAAVLCFGLSAQSAMADEYSCSDAMYGTSSSTYGPTYTECSDNHTANQTSTVSTAAAVLKTATTQAAGLVSSRVSAAMEGSAGGVSVAANGFSASQGISAGNGMLTGGIWAAGSWTDVQDDNASTSFDGDVYTGMAGIDFNVTSQTVLGVAVGYEDVDLDTNYNYDPFTGRDGKLDGEGYTVAPYLGVALGPNASANLTVGYSSLEYDTVRYDPIVGNQITGSTDAERYFVSAAAGGSHNFSGNWRLRGKGTVFYASEEKDAFTETESSGETISQASESNDFGQVIVDAKLGYVMNGVEPYALVGAEYDFVKDQGVVAAGQTQSMDSDFGARFGAGLDFNLGSNVNAGIQAYTVEFRDEYTEYNVLGGLRVNF